MTPDLCDAFRRNPDGSWTCTRPSTITVGAGEPITIETDRTVQPGELLGDYDLVAYLEQTCARNGSAD